VSAPEERRETESPREEPAPAEHHADARADEERRAQVLLRILAPLVHRLNNSLAVVQGVHELGAGARDPERELARRELAVMAQVLARLASLARTSAPRPRPVALGEILRTHELLLAPLAASLGVALELRAEGEGTGAVEVDARLERLLLATSTAFLACGAGAPRARLRLVARATTRGLGLSLGTTGCADSSADLAALRALARELGGRQSVRRSRGAQVVRLTLAAGARAHATPSGVNARCARRVLLLHAADVERELVSALLRENGWNVSASAVEPRAGAFDLALVERRLAQQDPSLPARIQRRFALERVALLEPRMRPGALLALLS